MIGETNNFFKVLPIVIGSVTIGGVAIVSSPVVWVSTPPSVPARVAASVPVEGAASSPAQTPDGGVGLQVIPCGLEVSRLLRDLHGYRLGFLLHHG